MYKNHILCLCLLAYFNIFGQNNINTTKLNNIIRCGSESYVEEEMHNNAEYRDLVEATRKNRDKIVNNFTYKKQAACPNGEVLVPVAVHFDTGIGTDADERTCLISLVNTQMDVLNKAFNGLNDVGCTTTPNNGACIRFQLANATHPPSSNLNNGEPAITYDGAFTCPNANPCNINVWGGYLNVVVQDMLSKPNGPLGIAPLNGNPSGGGADNTILVDLCGFGTEEVFCDQAGPNSCGAGFKYRNGNTTVHEAGHFYGLEHTFCRDDNGNLEGGTDCDACTGSLNCDGFSDTPAQCHSNYTCFSGTCSNAISNPCGGTAKFNNFMDYLVDKCMNSFSPQQTTAINQAAETDGYRPNAIIENAPDCDFNLRTLNRQNYVSSSQNLKVCGSSVFVLEESSINNPATFSWNFVTSDGLQASLSSSSLANPEIQFTGQPGTLTVQFSATNLNGTCSAVLKNYTITPSLKPTVSSASCSDSNTASVQINLGNTIGNLNFSPSNLVSGNGTGSSPYKINANSGSNCNPVSILIEDEGITVQKGNFEILEPFNLAGSYTSGTNNVANFGIDIEDVSPCITGKLALVNDGTAPTADFCSPEPPTKPSSSQCNGLAGNIAIIDRGDCFFTAKIENAQACGAIAAVICNCLLNSENCNAGSETEVIDMSGESVNPINIPSVFISYQACEQIKLTMQDNDVKVCIGAERSGGCTQSISVNACELCSNQNAGCTDPCSGNFNPLATTNDGSCQSYPQATITGLPSSVFNDNTILLNGSPSGGTFSGTGVSFNVFNPNAAGFGLHQITYTYTNSNGCNLSTSEQILVGNITYNFVNYNLYFDAP